MNFTFNGIIPENINYNGTPLNKLQYNGVTVWEKSEPDGCVRLLGNNSYFKTDYIMTGNSSFEVKFMKDTPITNWTSIFGQRKSSNSYKGVMNFYINSNGGYFCKSYNGNYNNSLAPYTNGTTYTCKVESGKITINGVEYTNNSDFSTTTWQIYPIWIGGLNLGGSQADNGLNGIIYYFKIYENGVLVRDYRPEPSGKLFCKITGKEATLVGSAEYVAVPE